MTGPDYDRFCRLVAERSGLVLGPDKGYLVSSRLEPVARQAGYGSAAALLSALGGFVSPALVQTCVDALATHESLFFRDGSPFEQLAQSVLPALHAARPPGEPIRIWCAACSSGQEPYSIAMLALEQAQLLPGRRIEILATDMVEAILGKARTGIYSTFEVQRGLSPERRARWLVPKADAWEVSPRLKAMVRFQAHNLLEGARGLGGPFDVVFCRNVLIYFDQAGKRKVLAEIAQATAGDGALFLGSAETVLGLSEAFELTPGSRGLYRRRPGLTAAA